MCSKVLGSFVLESQKAVFGVRGSPQESLLRRPQTSKSAIGELHSPKELFERDATFGMSMLVFVVEETEQGTMCKTYVYSPCWIEATDLLLS
jgi:hypothetical protein